MGAQGAPFSYSFESQKQDVPLGVDSGTPQPTQKSSTKEVRRVVRFRHAKKGKRR